MPYLTRTADVWELWLGTEGVELDPDNPENRFTDGWLETTSALVGEVADHQPAGLVITASGKFFSNGLDTDRVAADPAGLPDYLDHVHALYSAVLTLPVPTVAAINGHAFGAGAMLALCADQRVMRTERGYWSLPEVLLGMPFTRGMAALIRTRCTDATASEAMFTGRRYGATEALDAGIVGAAVPADDLLATAHDAVGARSGTAGPALGVVKRGLCAPLLADLGVPTPPSLI